MTSETSNPLPKTVPTDRPTDRPTDKPFARGLMPAPIPVQFLDETGNRVQVITDDYPEPAPEQLVAAYRAMVIGRRFDIEATTLTKHPPPHLEQIHLPGVERVLDAIARLQWDDDPDTRFPEDDGTDVNSGMDANNG